MMKVLIVLSDEECREENCADISDRNDFFYYDRSGALCHFVNDEGMIILERKTGDHGTLLVFSDDAYASISAPEGSFCFSIKVLAITINNDMISIVYSVDSQKKRLEIIFRE